MTDCVRVYAKNIESPRRNAFAKSRRFYPTSLFRSPAFLLLHFAAVQSSSLRHIVVRHNAFNNQDVIFCRAVVRLIIKNACHYIVWRLRFTNRVHYCVVSQHNNHDMAKHRVSHNPLAKYGIHVYDRVQLIYLFSFCSNIILAWYKITISNETI